MDCIWGTRVVRSARYRGGGAQSGMKQRNAVWHNNMSMGQLALQVLASGRLAKVWNLKDKKPVSVSSYVIATGMTGQATPRIRINGSINIE